MSGVNLTLCRCVSLTDAVKQLCVCVCVCVCDKHILSVDVCVFSVKMMWMIHFYTVIKVDECGLTHLIV